MFKNKDKVLKISRYNVITYILKGNYLLKN